MKPRHEVRHPHPGPLPGGEGVELRWNRASLLPPGEGQDEGMQIMQRQLIDTLTPTLSRGKRELVGRN